MCTHSNPLDKLWIKGERGPEQVMKFKMMQLTSLLHVAISCSYTLLWMLTRQNMAPINLQGELQRGEFQKRKVSNITGKNAMDKFCGSFCRTTM
jgi:hypothetical protein